jgi:biopolymer transport protein ExbD
MGIKSRNKVSAEFSMSSLTDIIFLLLIFFMLTSSLVQINIDIPEADSKTVASTDIAVMIHKDGQVLFNGRNTTYGKLPGQVRSAKAAWEGDTRPTVSIIAEKDVDWGNISKVMRVADDLQMRAIILTKPKQ